MASGNRAIADEDGDYPDWIEIHNPATNAVNLNGWFLTDNATNLVKWRLPSVNVAARSNIVVFASGKDRTTPRLHANFSLDADGEFLALVQPDGVTIGSQFAPEFPSQISGYSYGVFQGTNYYFATPSPRTNNAAGLIARVADTKFSVDRGFFEAPFDLVLTCDMTNAAIRYTTNGAPPTAATGVAYSGPIAVGRTTVIRAAAFRTGYVPSNVDTHTYIFLDDVIRQSPDGSTPPGWPSSWGQNVVDYGMDPNVVNSASYSNTIKNDLQSIPTLSIVTEFKNLFDSNTGIYANPSQDGIEWERPTSLELVHPDDRTGFQVDAGLRIRGGFSRDTANPKHSMRFIFRSEYGDRKLRYEFFGPDGDDTIDKLDLRISQDNSWAYQGDASGTFLPDPFCRDTQLAMSRPGTRGDFYHVYINGQYWGIYNTEERPEAEYAASYCGGRPEEYDVIKVEAGPYDVVAGDGTIDAWRRLWQAATNGFASDANFQRIRGNNPDGTPNPAYEVLLDVPNLIDYMLVIVYAGDYDGPVYLDNFPNNFYAFRHQTRRDGFRFATHDAELSLTDVNYDRTQPITVGDPAAGSTFSESNPQYVWQRLQANTEFRLLVADHTHRHFFNRGVLTPAACAARYAARTNEIHRAVVGESARWGDAKREPAITRANWVQAVASLMNNYFPRRSSIVLNQLRNRGLYPTNDAPRFNQHGGVVTSGFSLSMSATNGTIYYALDGTDPRLTGGTISSGAVPYLSAFPINESVVVKARARSGNSWSALTEAPFYVRQDVGGLLLTEIMYHPPDNGDVDGDEFEFIELKNASGAQLDLSGLGFTNGIRFEFPIGTKLSPGAFAVLVSNPAEFARKYPAVPIAGAYAGHLSNSGETLALVDAAGSNFVTIAYGDNNPWPQAADGLGFSLVPVNPNLNPAPADAVNWRASSVVGGSPGADDPGSSQPRVIITEVLTHTDPPQLDSIELHNPATTNANIGNWFLTDDRTEPKKFRIPSPAVIPAGGYLVFDEADFNASPGASNSFNLSSHGDEVYLYSADTAGNLTGYSEGLSFSAAANGVSFGRYVNSVGEIDYPAQTANSLDLPNVGPRVGPVVINEIRYAPAAGYDEFIELKNITASAVKLYDPEYPTNAWKLEGAGFSFPSGIEIAPNGLLLVTRLDPALFRAKYSVPASVPVFGPYTGALQDNGERLELQRPDAPDLVTNGAVVATFVPYISVDAVRYNDRAPWPTNVAGAILSLERFNASAYGNDPANWRISPGLASPGFENNGNRPPVVFAGLDQQLDATGFPFSANLSGTVTDDGQPNPPGVVNTTWSQVSGAGAVMFADSRARTTTVSFPGVGTYVLRFTAHDGALQNSDDVSITIQRTSTPFTLVSTGSVWKYHDQGADLGTAWRELIYDDGAWFAGPAELGYGDNSEGRPEATVVSYGTNSSAKHITTYFRRGFVVTNAAAFTDLTVNLMRDDGAAVYLNGTNIFVSNLPSGSIDYLTRAPNSMGGADEYSFFSASVPPALLREGTNVLAVEVHQTVPDSSDISFDLELGGHRLPVNQPPVASAGTDRTIDIGQLAPLSGVVSDDGLPIPPGLLTNGWSKVSGPGAVTFENGAASTTKAGFGQAGVYTLRLTAGDGAFTRASDVTVTVTNGIASWKAQYFTAAELANPAISGDAADPDGDGYTNLQEYVAGTNPRDPASHLELQVEYSMSAAPLKLRFNAVAGKTYSVQFKTGLGGSQWVKLADVAPASTNRVVENLDYSPLGGPAMRFYRLVTPGD
jgi:CotH protein/chitobiase/beta-hexosaminidase-like protein/lamin tail-like protein/K319-like protein/Fn3 domain-containing protein